MTIDRKAIEQGREFEDFVADALGGRKQPGSGNKFFALMDVSTASLLVSAKAEKSLTFNKLRHYLLEAIEAAFGTGKRGALVFRDKDHHENYILIRLEDYIAAHTEGYKIPESKSVAKRRIADVPMYLRDNL